MAVKVIKAQEVGIRPVRVLIYGEPGSGKTTLLASAPKPLLVIDFEGGSDLRLAGLSDVDIVPVHSKAELIEALRWLKTQTGYRTIAFDGFSVYTQQALREVLEERGKASPTFYEWGLLSSHLRDVILGLLKPASHTVFTALLKKKDLQENGQTITYRYPDLPQSVRAQLRAVADFEGILWVDKESKRWLGFTAPKGGAEVKDRSGRLTDKEEPDISKLIHKVFQKEASR